MFSETVIRRCIDAVLNCSQRRGIANVEAIKTTPIRCANSVHRFLDRYDTFLFDCDGVLWGNDHVTPIDGISSAISMLQKLGKKLIYVTNNSTTSRLALQKKFTKYGFESPMENIFGPGYVSAKYLKEVLKVTGKTYLVCGDPVKWELDQLGMENVGCGSDVDKPTNDIHELLDHSFHDDIEAVLVGFDEHFSFNKIYKAASYVSNPHCHFVATNSLERGMFIGSAIYNTETNRRRLPLTGVMVNSVAIAANREPFVVGKPSRTMFDFVLKAHSDLNLKRTVFVGDNLKADMAFARTVGIDSALVLTGVHKVVDIQHHTDFTPTYVLNSLADIAC